MAPSIRLRQLKLDLPQTADCALACHSPPPPHKERVAVNQSHPLALSFLNLAKGMDNIRETNSDWLERFKKQQAEIKI
jgi:hypothetical protein